MEHYVGIDVSLEQSSLCVLDVTGKIVREAKVASEPEALVACTQSLDLAITRVGLEAGPLSHWLYDGLHEAGLAPVLLETRHVEAALSFWSEGQVWCSPERHGAVTGVFKNQSD